VSRRHLRLLPEAVGPGFTAPTIEAVEAVDPSVPRPRISVMIPTHNCADYLRACLQSVLRQDPGPALMQIEVLDDCSTLDDPEAVVRELGGDRVVFTRQERNVGAVANFNDCIRRARGELVHILHGDDLVQDGFYTEIERMAAQFPSAGLFATRVDFVDEVGNRTGTSAPIDGYRGGSHSLDGFRMGCPLQFAGTVARRSAYEEHGGFLPALVHTADYEMWMRLTARCGLATSPHTLAAYRQFAGQHTAKMRRTAENLLDAERALAVVHARGDDLHLPQSLQLLRTGARRQAERFLRAGDHDAAQANLRYWLQRATLWERLRRRAGIIKRRTKR